MAGADNMARFSDTELTTLRTEFELHRAESQARWNQLAGLIEENTRITTQLARSIEAQARSTAGIVRLYRDAQGAARLGTGMQRFFIFLLKWGLVGSGIVTAIRWALTKFGG